ncbi:hypothetical protein DF051_36335 [Burkholderia contaminans]|uniref:Uncharacterized protein n=1 Tax=Burkholderia contaminans TaxID=488447 RepID=A0A3N8QG84_9BURK|nr:hypothetical protein DF051_36335 [Burkholderia contaminans]
MKPRLPGWRDASRRSEGAAPASVGARDGGGLGLAGAFAARTCRAAHPTSSVGRHTRRRIVGMD